MPEPIVQFPSGIDSAATLLAPFDVYRWKSFLKYACDASETILTLTDGDDGLDIFSGLANNYIGIDSEICFCESVDNTGSEKKITVVRGCGYSIPSTHTVSGLVQNVFVAAQHNLLREAVIAIEESILGTSGSLPMPLNQTFSGTITSDSFVYPCPTYSGCIFDTTVSVKKAANDRINRGFTICQWGDTAVGQYYQNFLFNTDDSSTGEVSVSDFPVGSGTFNININNCNGGAYKISLQYKGRTE